MTGSRNFSFDINSSRQRLDKMICESERLEATTDRTEKSDHAINAATDGWHLHEWVWAEVKQIQRSDPMTGDNLDPGVMRELRLQNKAQKRSMAKLQAEIGEELGINPANVGTAAFGQFMAKRYRAIDICRIIATGSKHLGVENAEDVETLVSASSSTTMSPISTRPMAVDLIHTGVPKIKYGGTVYASSDVFREAEQNWTEFIYNHRIDD